MATQESFSNYYVIDNSGKIISASSYSTSLTDISDGSVDGSTAVGDTLHWSLASNVALVGTTANGVALQYGSYTFLVSNTSYSIGNNVTVNTTDPYIYCFLQGTQILTPQGERNIESLKMGDKVLTADGRAVNIRWMGFQTIHNRIGTSEHREPVKISAHALGQGLPHTDLYVTGSHAIVMNNMLINASVLCNDNTIHYVPLRDMPESFTYWHIETDEHEAIIANGLAAETFVDAPDRRAFDNYTDYVDFYGVERIIKAMPLPRATDIRHLPEHLITELGLTVPTVDWATLVEHHETALSLKQGAA